jgi:acyl-coenzyme A synthetase/AMP-(fatty) acid ligase
VGETGYLEVQAPTIALGYYKDPEWTARMFRDWVATGDVAFQDADGDFYHQGRATDIIKIRGHFVNPGDIEESLQTYPGVSQSAVVSRLGINDIEIIEAYVVADGTVTPKDLRKWILSKHERYMCPKIFYLVEELPRTDTGKVQRYLLRK